MNKNFMVDRNCSDCEVIRETSQFAQKENIFFDQEKEGEKYREMPAIELV